MSLDLRNCKSCGRAFQYSGDPICNRCQGSVEEEYKRVKEYLYENPGASVGEVSEATEVSEKRILKFLREGRLEIKDDTNFVLDCERCGVSIKSGRYCDGCAHAMSSEFSAALAPKKKKPEENKPANTKKSQKMHVNVSRKK